jgi:hypothetical protein
MDDLLNMALLITLLLIGVLITRVLLIAVLAALDTLDRQD